MTSSGRPLIIFAAFVISAAGIKAAESVMVPFLLAIFIATIAATPVFWLNKHRVPIGLAIAGVVALIVVALLGLGALVAQSVNDFVDKLPLYQTRIDELVSGIITFLESFGLPEDSKVSNFFDPGTAFVMVGSTLLGFGNALSNGFLILLTVIFILAEASSFPKKLQTVLKNPDRDMPHFEEFATNVNRYIAIKTSVSVATGLIVTVLLAILGVDFPILWGLLAFMLNYIPTIGSIIAAVPAVLLTLLQLGPTPAIIVTIGYVSINLVMGNVVEPKLLGKGLGLSTLVVFLSLVFWGWMLGPVGMLLSVPLTMTAKIAMQANPNTEWVAHLLGPEEA